MTRSGPVGALCWLLGLGVLTAALWPGIRFGDGPTGGGGRYEITVDYPVGDPETVEREITFPLEEGLSRLPGVTDLRSVSDGSQCRITFERDGTGDPGLFTADLAETVDRAASSFPRSAQRPRCVALSRDLGPAWAVALAPGNRPLEVVRDWADRVVRPGLGRLPGVGQVEVTGGRESEVMVTVDEARAAFGGLGTVSAARALQARGDRWAGGRFRSLGTELPVTLQGRWETPGDWGATPVPGVQGGAVPLSTVSMVGLTPREPEKISRLDGSERVVVSVYPAPTADLVCLTRTLGQTLARLDTSGYGFQVLSDRGRDREAGLGRTFWAWAGTWAVLLAASAFCCGRFRTWAGGAVSVLGGHGLALAALGVLGIPVTQETWLLFLVTAGPVAGGVWASVRGNLGETWVPSLAVLLVLAPLGILLQGEAGVRTEVLVVPVLALGATWGTSALGCRLWTTPGFSSGVPVEPKGAGTFRIVGYAGAVLAAVGLAAGFSWGWLKEPPHAREASVHWEFAPGTPVGTVDSKMRDFTRELLTWDRTELVHTVSSQGAADLRVRWKHDRPGPESRDMDFQRLIQGVPGNTGAFPGDDSRTVIRVSFRGDSPTVLETLARGAARELNTLAGVAGTALHFKEPLRRVAVVVDPEPAAARGISAAEAAQELRWALTGPVVVKWTREDRETDVRVRGRETPSGGLAGLGRLTLAGAGGPVTLGSLSHQVEAPGGGKLFHEDRRRSACLTLYPLPGTEGPRPADLDRILASVALPPGYEAIVDHPGASGPFPGRWALGLGVLLVLVGLGALAAGFRSAAGTASRLIPVLLFPLAGVLAWAGEAPSVVLAGVGTAAGGMTLGVLVPGTRSPLAWASAVAGTALTVACGPEGAALGGGLFLGAIGLLLDGFGNSAGRSKEEQS